MIKVIKITKADFYRSPRLVQVKKNILYLSVQEIIKTNKNDECAGHVQIKLPCIPTVPDCCNLAVERITVGRSFSQLFEVEPKHRVAKMGITCQGLTNHRLSQNRRFSVFLGASGIQGNERELTEAQLCKRFCWHREIKPCLKLKSQLQLRPFGSGLPPRSEGGIPSCLEFSKL